MKARDLAEHIPTVTTATTGAQAARLVAEHAVSGVVVADQAGVPFAVVPGSQLLGLLLPRYVRFDTLLARTFDEASADEVCQRLGETTIGELLEMQGVATAHLPSVEPDATLLEIAAEMFHSRSPVLVVHDADGAFLGTVTVSRVLAAVALKAGQDSAGVRERIDVDLLDRLGGGGAAIGE